MQSVRFQGNSGDDSVVYYCQIIVASDFLGADDESYVQNSF